MLSCQDLAAGKQGNRATALMELVCALQGIDCQKSLGCDVTRPTRIAGSAASGLILLAAVLAYLGPDLCPNTFFGQLPGLGCLLGALGGLTALAAPLYFYIQTGSNFGLPTSECDTDISYGGFIVGGVGLVVLGWFLHDGLRARSKTRIYRAQEPLMQAAVPEA